MTGWLSARNILVVRLDNIGDVVMLGPALRAMKEALPQARITLLGTKAGMHAVPLLPWVDDAIEWRPIWQDVGGTMPLDPEREHDLIGLMKARRFDAAIVFTSFSQTPHAPGYACYLAGIPLRAGESKEFGGSVLTTELRGAEDGMHQVERNLRLVEALGFPVADRRLQVSVADDDCVAARQMLTAAGVDTGWPVVLLHPGASAVARRFPAGGYAEVARLLLRQGRQVIVTGTEREAALVDEVVGGAPGAVPMPRDASLGQFAAMVGMASVVVCGNTLPLHLADALGTPVVALYSGTDLESQWQPRFVEHTLLRRDTPCHPCYLFECPIGQPCLDIPAGEIVDAVTSLLPAGSGVVRMGAGRG